MDLAPKRVTRWQAMTLDTLMIVDHNKQSKYSFKSEFFDTLMIAGHNKQFKYSFKIRVRHCFLLCHVCLLKEFYSPSVYHHNLIIEELFNLEHKRELGGIEWCNSYPLGGGTLHSATFKI